MIPVHRYNALVTRKVLIVGLMLIAALLPLAALPIAIFALESAVVNPARSRANARSSPYTPVDSSTTRTIVPAARFFR
jgi:hypothetical protein